MSAINVSVIIPVYNSAEYLRGAVESLLGQNFKSFEILLVDDGSTDGSEAICDQLSRENPSVVRVFHKSNGGMCSARNFGLKHVRGEYLSFMDNDDECLPGFISDNYKLAKQCDADCVRFGRKQEIIAPDGSVVSESVLAPSGHLVMYDQQIKSQYRKLRSNGNGVWAGLYKTSFVIDNSIYFDERLRHGHEDTRFNLKVFRSAHTIVLNPNEYYVWKQRMSHSSSMSFPQDFFIGLEDALLDEVSLMNDFEVFKSDPSFYREKVGSYLREALSVFCRSTNKIDRSLRNQYLEVIRSIFMKATNLTRVKRLSGINWVMLRFLLNKNYAALYWLVIAGYYAKHRKVFRAATKEEN